MTMLFTKKMDARCEYCKHGAPLGDDKVFCVKRGVMIPDSFCRKFRYDPLKRVPPRPSIPDFSRLKDSDFHL